MLNFALLLLAATSAAATNANDRQKLLDCHNKFRAKLALGKVPGQPSAADMTAMDYDTQIEAKATIWNDQCKVGHDPKGNRLVNRPEYKKFTWIGQNWAGFTRGPVTSACDMWWNEYKHYSFDKNKSTNGKAVGHYTQMAWSRSTIIGCGVSRSCRNSYGQHFTCNYAYGGNFNRQKPYKVGKACSQCPDGYNYCMDGALCARKDQCKSGKCRCALKCKNGGSLDESSCKCNCQTGYFGQSCQKKCEDNNKYCNYNIDCKVSYWKNNCQKKCKNCINAVPFVTKFSSGMKVRTGLGKKKW